MFHTSEPNPENRRSLRFLFVRNMVLIALASLATWNMIWLWDVYKEFQTEKEQFRQDYIDSQKALIKDQVATAISYVNHMRNQTEQRLRQSIKSRVNEAIQITTNIYEQNKDSKQAAEIKKMIKDALRPIRFSDGRGYYFAFTLAGVEELFADRPELEGTNMLSVQGGQGEYVVKDMLDIAARDEKGFYRYTWTKPDRGNEYFPKIAYVKMFAPYGWVIGTGEYIDDVEGQMKNEALDRLVGFRFGEEGYFFGSTYDGDSLFSNGKLTKETGNIWGVTDPTGVKIIQEQSRMAQTPGGGFVSYVWNKLGSTAPSQKISYVRGIPEWKWIVGTGVYLDTVADQMAAREKSLIEKFKQHVIRSLVVLVILMVLLIWWANRFSNKISLGLIAFSNFFQRAAADSKPMDLNGVYLTEFVQIAEAANKMFQERQVADEELKASEDKFRRLFEMESDSIFLIDNESGQILEANESATTNYGYSREEFLRRKNTDISTEPDLTSQATKDNLEQVPIRWHKKKDRTIFPVEIAASHFEWQGRPVHIAAIRDISERQMAEAAMREREERVRAKLDAILLPEGDIGVLDLSDIIDVRSIQMLMNDFFSLTSIGVAILDKHGKALVVTGWQDICTKFHRVNPETRANCLESDTLLSEGVGPGEFKLYKCKNNMWDVVTPIYVANQHVGNLFLGQFIFDNEEADYDIFRSQAHQYDFDEDKYLAALDRVPRWSRQTIDSVMSFYAQFADLISNLSYSNLKLARILEERSRSEEEKSKLESQLRQAQKMEALGTLAGGVAHDFNNILTAIIGYSELALDDAESGVVNPKPMKEVIRAGNRAKELVIQILSFSRKLEPMLQPVSLNKVVLEAEAMFKRTIPRMISLEHNLADNLWLVNADANQLHQVIMNLGSNAADAMTNGGRLVFETENVTLDADYSKEHAGASPGDHVLLMVSDTGHGMDKETLERIFDPFFTQKAIGKGTGLGLATVYGIVKNHGGYTICYSEPGQGTTFKVYLPAIESNEETRSVAKIDEAEFFGGSETILLVDDDEALRNLGQRILSPLGYKSLLAETGEEALRVYQEKGAAIDLIILDISMPGMGGHKCLQELLKINPKVKVVISSGYSRNGQLKDTLASGAAGNIPKPFSKSEMLKTVREVLDG